MTTRAASLHDFNSLGADYDPRVSGYAAAIGERGQMTDGTTLIKSGTPDTAWSYIVATDGSGANTQVGVFKSASVIASYAAFIFNESLSSPIVTAGTVGGTIAFFSTQDGTDTSGALPLHGSDLCSQYVKVWRNLAAGGGAPPLGAWYLAMHATTTDGIIYDNSANVALRLTAGASGGFYSPAGYVGAGVAPLVPMHARVSTTPSGSPVDVLELDRISSALAYGVGDGASALFRVSNATPTLTDAGRISAKWTVATAASEESELAFQSMGGGTMSTAWRMIQHSGYSFLLSGTSVNIVGAVDSYTGAGYGTGLTGFSADLSGGNEITFYNNQQTVFVATGNYGNVNTDTHFITSSTWGAASIAVLPEARIDVWPGGGQVAALFRGEARVGVTSAGGTPNTGSLSFAHASTAYLTKFQASGSATAAVTYTWPTAAPTADGQLVACTTAGQYSFVSVPAGILVFGLAGPLPSGVTRYLYPGANVANVAEVKVEVRVARTITRMSVQATSAPGGILSDVYTVRKNGVDTALTVTVTGAAVEGHDDAHSVSFAVGDLISVKLVSATLSLSADAMVSLE